MDAFTSLLTSEIKNKKRQLEEASTTAKVPNGGKKYVKRADLERQREKAYWEEQAQEEQARKVDSRLLCVLTAKHAEMSLDSRRRSCKVQKSSSQLRRATRQRRRRPNRRILSRYHLRCKHRSYNR